MIITREFQPFFGLQSLDFVPQMFLTAKMSHNGQVVAIIGIVKVQPCIYQYSGIGLLTYGNNFMEISQCKTVYFVNILTVQFFLLTENRVESVKKYATYLNLQSTLAISNICYLEFCAISNFFPDPVSIYGLLIYCWSTDLEIIFWSLGRITVAISNFSENVAHRNQSMIFFFLVCLNEFV